MNQVISLQEYRDATPELLKEANHRIANQLSMLVAMIQTQIASVRKGPQLLPREEAGNILREMAGKIVGIAHLHRRMAEQPCDSEIDVGDFLIEIVRELGVTLSLGDRLSVRQTLSAGCIVNTDQAHTLSLLLSEIVMNAIKHAHPTGIPIDMSIDCRPSGDGGIVLEICDDGVGLPEGFDAAKDGGVGFRLIRTLVGTLNATMQIESDDLGLCFHIALPASGKPE